MTNIKGYYQDGVIKLLDANNELKDGQIVKVVPQNNHIQKETEELFNRYFGSAKIYGNTKEIDEYIKECRAE